MSRRVLFLEEQPDGWLLRDHLGQVLESIGGETDAQIDRLTAILQQGRGMRVLLLLASTSVFVVAVSTDQDVRRLPYQAQLYALETFLPMPAEEMTADMPAGSAMAFVIETDRYARVIDILSHGSHITAIVPYALLQLQCYLSQVNAQPRAMQIVLADPMSGWNVFELVGKRVERWHWFSTVDEVVRELEESDPQAITWLKNDASIVELPEVVREVQQAVLTVASCTKFFTKIASGKIRPWVNFYKANYSRRRERSQSQRAWTNLFYMAGTCLLVLAGCLWWKTDAYRQESLALEAQQREVFQQAFPGLKVPSALFTRFQSERKKLTATRQNPIDGKLPTNAVLPLSRLLQVIQDEQNLIVKRISVSSNESMLETIFRTHGEAQVFSEKLQQKQLFAEAPASVQLDVKHVSSTFVARHEAKEAP